MTDKKASDRSKNEKNEDIRKNNEKYLDMVRKICETIQYGTLSICIQDGRIVQVDKNEKYRL